MNLSDRHRRLLLVEQGSHALLINIVLNGVIAWALLRGNDVVPLWGDVSMGVDLLATGVLLPVGMCEIVSRIVAGQVRSGKLPALEPAQVSATGMHRRSIHLRALVLAVFGLVGISLPLVFLLDAANAQPVAFGSFIAFKAAWAGILAMILSPIVAWWALAGASAEVLDLADA